MGKLTGWFPPEIKPARIGLYECKWSDLNWYWNGSAWRNAGNSFDCTLQNRYWRGLASDPAKGANHD